MNEEYFISIIVPIYNSERYIENICRQLAHQTFKNFEVLFIDDASTDKSYSLLLQQQKKYSFLKVLQNEKNEGAGYSRNKGIQEAKYDYIGFLDSDDEIPDNYFECLTNTLFKEKADLVLCDIKVCYETSFKKNNEYVLASHDNLVQKKDILNNPYAAAAWNKIIKKSLLEENPFAENIISEDIPAILGAIIDAQKIAYTNQTYYNYIQRQNSVQNGSTIAKKFDVFKSVDILIDRKKTNAILEENMAAILYQQIITFFLFGIINNPKVKGTPKVLKQFYKKAKKYNWMHNPYLIEFIDTQSQKNKIFYKTVLKLMTFHFYTLTEWFIKVCRYINEKSRKKVVYPKITFSKLKKMAIKNQKQKNEITVSVIIPNYNYKEYLMERVYSILIQKEKINEIIFLDDASSDESVSLINEIIEMIGDYVLCRTVYNKINSGSPYKQWQEGFKLSSYDYVWIAEADDYSNENFLTEVLKPIKKDKNIMISYCDTSYINQKGYVLTKSVKPLIDVMNTGHWDRNYINKGLKEIENYAFLNCTIANVSSAVIKNNNYDSIFKKACVFKQCGDWYFYYSLMRKGNIAYSTKALNYARLHGNNSTANLEKRIHFEEIKYIQEGIMNKESVRMDAREQIKKRLAYLEEEWKL